MSAIETMDMEMVQQPVRDVAQYSTGRLLTWQVKRELWENRSVWIAPAATAVVMLVLWVFGLVQLLRHPGDSIPQGEAPIVIALNGSWTGTTMLLLFVGLLVAFFYSLDALYSERRERNVLFWKSMPVSNAVTVVAKFVVPMVIVPIVTLVIALVMEVLILGISIVVLLFLHVGVAGALHAGFFNVVLWTAYWCALSALWYAPIYGFLLLVSVLAPRQPFLLTVVPVLVLMGVEAVTWHTVRLGRFVGHCFSGVFLMGQDTSSAGFQGMSVDRLLGVLTPGRFFASPHLWVGLVLAGVFVWLAVQRRRYMPPM